MLTAVTAPAEKEYLLSTFQALAARRDLCELLCLICQMLLHGTDDQKDKYFGLGPYSSREFGILRLLERVLMCVDGRIFLQKAQIRFAHQDSQALNGHQNH